MAQEPPAAPTDRWQKFNMPLARRASEIIKPGVRRSSSPKVVSPVRCFCARSMGCRRVDAGEEPPIVYNESAASLSVLTVSNSAAARRLVSKSLVTQRVIDAGKFDRPWRCCR